MDLTLTSNNVLLIGSILLFIGVLASKTSGRLGVPALLLFMVIGMLAGSDGIGGIHFDNPGIAQWLGVVALTFILFSGGLDTRIESIRPVLWRGVTLSTVGVLGTTVVTGLVVSWFTPFTIIEGLLLGAIVSSTDAAAVFSILRSRNIGLKNKLRPLLELESGSNDPMAFFLVIGFTALLQNGDTSVASLVPLFVQQMTIGALFGFLFGKAMIWIINRIQLDIDGLYPVLTLALMLFAYASTTFVGGNGFLAVYLAAILLGNSNFIHKKSLMRFYDGQAWLMQIIMFLTLGLLVYPREIIDVLGVGALASAVLIFIARPAGVFLSLVWFRMPVREMTFVSWVGLRGAVPIVFATYPMLAGIDKSPLIFNIVFFVVLTSVLLQGSSIPLMARWLYVYKPSKFRPPHPLELETTDRYKGELIELDVPPSSRAVGKPIVELLLPKSTLIVLINRDNQYITPNGNTVIQPNDHLVIMATNKTDVQAAFSAG